LLKFSGIAVAGVKFSNCLEYLLFAGGVGMARVATEGRGDPEEGMYAKLLSRPAKESYCHQLMSKWSGGTMAYSISLLLVGICFRPKLLDSEEESNSVPDLINAYLLQYRLVHLKKVLSIYIILPEQLLIFTTVDTP
jgi:hypothetical protein